MNVKVVVVFFALVAVAAVGYVVATGNYNPLLSEVSPVVEAPEVVQ